MRRNVVETILGAVVLVVAIGFLVWAYVNSDGSGSGGYTLRAEFSKVDGLETGADVRISGIKVGEVLSQSLDPQSYRAEVRFSVDPQIELPADTSAAVVSSGLLGGKYLALEPGADTAMLNEGETITFTQSSILLEDLIGRFVFGSGGSDGGGGGGSGQGGGGSGSGGGGEDAQSIFN